LGTAISLVSAEPPNCRKVDVEDDVLGGAEVLRHASRGVELSAMALPVPEGERVTREPLALGDGEGGGGVEAPERRMTARSGMRQKGN